MSALTPNVILQVEDYLQSKYRFRRNLLNSGKTEYTEDDGITYQAYTSQSENTVVREAKFAFPKYAAHIAPVVKQYVNSTVVPQYNAIDLYIKELPEWDGEDHVTNLFSSLSGITDFQLNCMNTWFRSMVAHWLPGVDPLHGNEIIPVIIGPQGCGKTTFCRNILPPQLRGYFADQMNFSNKFDSDMALTNSLLVNIDEFAGVTTAAQQAKLKWAVSRNKVVGRPIFGKSTEDRKRYASFIASTNEKKPLHDHTGSRRYICIALDEEKLIDTEASINYSQLYAQALAEVKGNIRYWFTHEEETYLQEQNIEFQAEDEGFDAIVSSLFTIPESTEEMTPYTLEQLTENIRQVYPNIEYSQGTAIRLGSALQKKGFPHKYINHKRLYYVNSK